MNLSDHRFGKHACIRSVESIQLETVRAEA
jgi:hypothetical protein